MTEAEWLTCTDLTPMLIFLRGEVEPNTYPRSITSHGALIFGEGKRVSPWKLRQFAHEVCKLWWELPLDPASRHLVIRYELFLTGDGSWDEFVSSAKKLCEARRAGERALISTLIQWFVNPFGISCLVQSLAWVTACHQYRERIDELERTGSEDDRFAWGFFGYDFPEFGATGAAIRQPLPALLREVVGNPFWPRQPLAWSNGTIRKIAQVIQEACRFQDMPVLADALAGAGCVDQDILAHCRGPGPHVRGCWVLDLLLRKD